MKLGDLVAENSTSQKSAFVPRPTPCWVGPSHLARAYPGNGRAWWDGGWRVCRLFFWRRVEWLSFSGPQTHVQGIKNAISGTVPVIHWVTHLWFEGSVAALELRPPTVWKQAPYVHPLSLIISLRLQAQWQGALPRPTPWWVGQAAGTLWGAYLGDGRAWWDGGWRVCKLSFGVEWNEPCFQALKHTARGSKTIFLALVPVIFWVTHQWFSH